MKPLDSGRKLEGERPGLESSPECSHWATGKYDPNNQTQLEGKITTTSTKRMKDNRKKLTMNIKVAFWGLYGRIHESNPKLEQRMSELASHAPT